VIIFNEGQPAREELLQGTLAEPATIPVVGISFADGAALYIQTQAGDVTARVFTSTENDSNRQAVNVIADSPEGKIKDETIVVGAHLDSVTAGPGINDNGSGSATILEIAEQLATLKYTDKLERQVRFAFWGAEEFVTLGSEHYVNTLTNAELTEIKALTKAARHCGVGPPCSWELRRFVPAGERGSASLPGNGESSVSGGL
jgi:Zn-dependent M28 family amino/carboxypeptidase